ncbi:hypothetical protein PRK78_000212 [Emydomyces testavorans]|uniref:Uncharacterized protein n=1 Tax=Emydomyces testavorans TaxID=2070801 RepID=A0AAF0DC34_9EURO|nr:hypothetical protein PRK78_000212 [Emydomyces testavorans]
MPILQATALSSPSRWGQQEHFLSVIKFKMWAINQDAKAPWNLPGHILRVDRARIVQGRGKSDFSRGDAFEFFFPFALYSDNGQEAYLRGYPPSSVFHSIRKGEIESIALFHWRRELIVYYQVFMTRRDTLKCVHEPFGDAFYYGPERMSRRYENDEKARIASGFSNSTYRTIFDRLDREASEGPRLFIKDMVYYLFPEDGQPASIVPSLQQVRRGIGTDAADGGHLGNGVTATSPHSNWISEEPANPTVVPTELLSKLHFAFLIRDPHYSIPSFYRCTIPPLDKLTGFYEFYESEAGYEEVRRFFDYLRDIALVGPHFANGKSVGNGTSGINGNDTASSSHAHGSAEICVVDADDLLDNPAGIIERFCESVGEEYTPDMLNWNNEKDQAVAKEAFEKWPGFHDDAMNSTSLKPRLYKQPRSEEEFDREWREKYGEKGAKIIRSAVDRSMPDYLYMKQFAIKV